MRRPLIPAAATTALLLIPSAGLAHPSFNPNEVAAGTATDATLVVPHGCGPHGGMPDGADALATIEFSLQLADGVTVEPGDVDGWDTTVGDGAVTWTDAGGATTDVLEFPVTVTVAPDAGPDFALAAFQQCEDDQFLRWTVEDADFPAVHLAVAGVGGGQDSHSDGDTPDDGDEPADPPSDTMDDHDATDEVGGDDGQADDGHGPELGDPLPAGAQALAGEQADAGMLILAIGVAGILVLLLAAGLIAVRRDH